VWTAPPTVIKPQHTITQPAIHAILLQVRHEWTCGTCGTTSHVVEQYSHLSLELPEAQVGRHAVLPLHAAA
jgi:hypothetical protein